MDNTTATPRYAAPAIAVLDNATGRFTTLIGPVSAAANVTRTEAEWRHSVVCTVLATYGRRACESPEATELHLYEIPLDLYATVGESTRWAQDVDQVADVKARSVYLGTLAAAWAHANGNEEMA